MWNGNPEQVQTIETEMKSCWDEFKNANCQMNAPMGKFCEEMYQCIRERRKYSERHKDKDLNEQEKTEEFEEKSVIGLIATIMVSGSMLSGMCYFLGTR